MSELCVSVCAWGVCKEGVCVLGVCVCLCVRGGYVCMEGWKGGEGEGGG